MISPSENKLLRYLDYFFIMRPTLFFPLWTFFLSGYYGANRANPENIQNIPVVPMILLTLLMGSMYIINQIVDEETDAKNDKLFFIAKGIISRAEATIQSAVLLFATLGVAFIISIKLGIIFLVIAFFTGDLYSIKPFSWKNKPLLSIITNFGGGWSIVACGWLASGFFDWQFALYALPFAVAIIAVFLLTTIPDIPGDADVGKITFGVRYGIKKTTFWALVFEVASAVIAFFLKEWILFVPAMLAMPLFVVAAWKKDNASIGRAIKFTVLFASLAVGWVYPLYVLLLAANYFFSKWYYRKRFGLEYPKFAA